MSLRPLLKHKTVFLFDWGNTIMLDYAERTTPMYTWEDATAMPHAREMLEYLSKRAKCYLATNAKVSTKREIEMALERAGLLKYFTEIFCFQELGEGKPSTRYFDCVTQAIGERTERMIMVGDTLSTDVIGALRYGIDAVLYDPTYGYKQYTGPRIVNLLELCV